MRAEPESIDELPELSSEYLQPIAVETINPEDKSSGLEIDIQPDLREGWNQHIPNYCK
jgi:hypothetical protein